MQRCPLGADRLHALAPPSPSELSTTGGTSDARFIKDFCPVAEFGLISQTMHKVDERTLVDDINKLSEIYETILRGYFQ